MEIMIIGISSQDGKMDTQFSGRFARCKYYLLVDSETAEWKVIDNPAVSATGGAGPQAVQLLVESGVDVVISGRFGPNAYRALEAAGLPCYVAERGTQEELVALFKEDKLEKISSPSGPGIHH